MAFSRRTFLEALTAAAAGLAFDPERALWVPGAKTIFLPSVRTPTLVTLDWVTRDTALFWRNNLRVGKQWGWHA